MIDANHVPPVANNELDLRRELGSLEASFTSNCFRLSGLTLFGLLLVVYGAGIFVVMTYLIIHKSNPADKTEEVLIWSMLAGIDALGLGMAAAGCWVIWWSVRKRAYRLDVYAEGFAHRVDDELQIIRWSDLAYVRRTKVYERLPLLHAPLSYLLPKTVSNNYLVRLNDGREITFGSVVVQNIDELGMILRRVANRQELPWEEAELDFS